MHTPDTRELSMQLKTPAGHTIGGAIAMNFCTGCQLVYWKEKPVSSIIV